MDEEDEGERCEERDLKGGEEVVQRSAQARRLGGEEYGELEQIEESAFCRVQASGASRANRVW